jgi:hypothetical protein
MKSLNIQKKVFKKVIKNVNKPILNMHLLVSILIITTIIEFFLKDESVGFQKFKIISKI